MRRYNNFSRLATIQRNFCAKKVEIVPPESRVLYRTSDNNKFCEVTLNNPKALNSFDVHMAMSLKVKLNEWEQNKTQVVLFKGAGGKAFCAGGDVKILYLVKKGLVEDPLIKDPAEYFRTEFTTDYRVATMKPLQISFWDGYVMGGGVGISIHSPVTIATEKAVFAMPEAKIGFFTDVAGGWFLSKLRSSIGMYLGLTSAQLRGEDIVKAGIAKYFVESRDLPALQSSIEQLVNNSKNVTQEQLEKEIYEVIAKYDKEVSGQIENEQLINRIFNKDSFQEIYKELELNSQNKEFTLKTLKQIDSNSPLSVRVIYEQIKRHKNLTLKDAFKSDYRTAYRFMNGIDFFEGVRCLLVDKGDKPKWEYEYSHSVPDEVVESYFKEIPQDKELD